jgi:MTH538 TIR-like domain (DUF1863)
MPKRRIFISFDHDDSARVNGFIGLRELLDGFDFYNHKLDRRVQSADAEYVARVIREDYVKPASVCVVLIGNNTANSAWVRWEIEECRRQGMGILGIRLKDTNGAIPQGVPPNAVGGWNPEQFPAWIEWAYQQRTAG